MKFGPDKHQKMAGLLHQRSVKSDDPVKAKKQANMADVFRKLARKAQKNKAAKKR